MPDENSPTSTSRSGLNTSVSVRKSKSGSAKSVSKKKSDDLWNGIYLIICTNIQNFPPFSFVLFCSVNFLDGNSPLAKSPLDPFLFMSLPPGVVVQDASLPVLTLLRILHAISRYWGTLYPSISYKSLLPLQVS